MKRIKNSFKIALLLFWVCGVVRGEPLTFEEGKHYQRAPEQIVSNPVIQKLISQHPNQVLVMEFFSYGCRWCYSFEPYLQAWHKDKPAYVWFKQIPVEFQASWHALTKAYYTARQLNVLDAIHLPLFEAIQANQITDTEKKTLEQFFVQQGVPANDFNKVFQSFEVNKRQKWANSVTAAYRITSVPAVIVQGQRDAFVTTVQMAGGPEELVQVMKHLIAMEHSQND